MITATLARRGIDQWGNGAYGSSRGKRAHKGIDFECPKDSFVHSPVSGRVTKLGYCYSDDLHFRYVEVTDKELGRHRMFYISPMVKEGELISQGDEIGFMQDIAGKYNTQNKTMKNHIHYEIIVKGEYVNPDGYF